MDRSKTHFDLRDALAAEGCPVCTLTHAAVDRYFATLNYEAAGDRGVRSHLRQTLGFCPPHAQRWTELAHVLATAVIYAEVIDQTLADLRGRAFRRGGWGGSGLTGRLRGRGAADGDADGLPPRATQPCPACVVRADSEEMLLGTLVAGFTDPAFHDAFAASSGVCLPHLRPALARAPDAATFAALRDATLAHQETLLAHLREVIRKHDYRFSEELDGEERGAGPRAVRHITGEPAP